MSNNIAIKAENLTKVYPIYEKKQDRMKEALSITRKKYHSDFHALDDVSFEIKKGETIGIIGQNGSGKSTLLKILTGVLSPTSGTVSIDGKVSALLELGAGFNPEMTGMENIYLNGTIMGYTKEEMEQKAPAIIEFADIGDFINQPVKLYSSGMFARLAFAVAINVEPDILIVDEALSVGDAFFQNKCFRKMDQLQKSGITILIVSHDISTIKQMCDRVMWLNNGIMKDFDEKTGVCEKYFAYQIELQNKMLEKVEINDPFKFDMKQGTKLKAKRIESSDSADIFSDKVSIESFFIEDDSGMQTNQLEVGKEYTFHTISRNNSRIENANFGIRFENIKGHKIYGTNTFLGSASKSIVLEEETYTEVILKTCIPKLQRGEYLITLAIADGGREQNVCTWLNAITKVNIVNEKDVDAILEMECDIGVISYEPGTVTIY